MKLKNLLNLMMLGAALMTVAVGCKTGPQRPKTVPNAFNIPKDPNAQNFLRPPLDQGTPVVTTQTPAGIPPTPIHDWPADPTMPLKGQTIYFEYDKASVKSAEHSKLQDVANYMKGHDGVAVRVEGNCDERGTEEYNRSLGERRALAAREYLVNLGVDASRIDTISYGEDKPAEQGHNEAAWSQNRRDDFVVLLQPKP
ncbi:MAG: peptidoglycan-associated lipoprotein [Pedosphaera sp.]|nr:peptidoglycan-associated lipoprotein [Pedosphaera sp.]